MKAFVYVLVLLFFTITNAQVTYWIPGGTNNSVSNTENWSNGVPTANSIVYMNDTGCPGCDIVVDKDMTVAELHMDAVTTTGPTLQIMGVHLTVTNAFSLGNPTTSNGLYVEITLGGIFELSSSCVANIYPTSSYPIYGNDNNQQNWFMNKGNMTFHSNAATSATSYDTISIGYGSSSSYYLNVGSWGSWIVNDPKVVLQFYYINMFNIYGGSFQGTWIQSSPTDVTIQFYYCEVVLQQGAGGDATGAGAVSFQYVYFESRGQNSDYYADPPPNGLTFNTTGVTVADSVFDGVNIVFLYDGWLMDCNITGSSLVNSSSTVSGVHAYIVGQNNNVYDSMFAGIGTDFIIEIKYGAQITMTSTFYIFGSVTIINNGTWVYNSGSSLYWDAAATWVNLGLMDVTLHSNDWIQGTTFPGLTTPTTVGTMANMGTIQFTNGGALDFYDTTGTFRQCSNGILKFQFTSTGSSSTSGKFPDIYLDGYIGVSYDDTFTSGQQLFTWAKPAGAIPPGSVKLVSNGPALSVPQIICFSPTGNDVTLYKITDSSLTTSGICNSGEYQNLVPIVGGDACSSLPDSIKNLADMASCRADAGCGLDTGSTGSGPVTPPPPSAANVNVASFAFLVSLVCLLLKF
jgi:hypothetical protein